MHEMCRSEAFRADSDDTQDATLRAIERLATRSGQSELAIAQTLLASMQSRHRIGGSAARRRRITSVLARRAGSQVAVPRAGRADVAAARLDALAASRAAAVRRNHGVGYRSVSRSCSSRVTRLPRPQLWFALAILLTLLPASEAVIAIVNRLISESVPPRRLPRLAFSDGIPAEHRVLVVIPSMLRQCRRKYTRSHASSNITISPTPSDTPSSRC